jgi:Arc/MetJ family transcription regulator
MPRNRVRTTIAIEDELLQQAQSLSGLTETIPLIKAALQAFIQRESARRLARIPRKRSSRRKTGVVAA